jgi:hypothetical protein
MIQRLDQLAQLITLKHALFSAAVFIGFMVFVLPSEAVALANATTSSLSADTSFTYSARQLYAIAESYGQAGRDYYILSRFRFDIAWPLAYGSFFFSAIAVSFRQKKGLLLLLPILSVVFDLLENLFVSVVFAAYPVELDLLAWFAAGSTLLKWTLLMGSVLLLLYGIVERIRYKEIKQ